VGLTLDEKAAVVLQRACEAVEGHADQYPTADQRLRGVVTATLVGVAFASVVKTNGWLFALRSLLGAVFVAIKYPWLNALEEPAHD
jgi:hypothetical protein